MRFDMVHGISRGDLAESLAHPAGWFLTQDNGADCTPSLSVVERVDLMVVAPSPRRRKA